MSITIELTAQQLARLKQLTAASDETEAVLRAMQEFLRISGLRELKQASGKVDYEDMSNRLEALELNEPFPQ